MPCYKPLRAFLPDPSSGSRSLVFSKFERSDLQPIQVPCQQCIGCRLARSRQWALRCVHEASLYTRNSFITLTYSPEHLPASGSLVKKDFQDFMKRLRKKFGSGVRYFHCGEYGEKNFRPHYHACLFNFDFSDRVLWSVRAGVRLYTSGDLSKLWPFGFTTVGDVTFESAAYVARYITKKVTGELAASHYERLDPVTGEVHSLLPEYITMSRRPGIGRGWLNKFSSDVYPLDRVVLQRPDGPILCRPPKYYDSVFQVDHPEVMEDIKFQRSVTARLSLEDCTPRRLAAREQHQYLRFIKLKRGYESA